jgi:hypothetical protein
LSSLTLWTETCVCRRFQLTMPTHSWVVAPHCRATQEHCIFLETPWNHSLSLTRKHSRLFKCLTIHPLSSTPLQLQAPTCTAEDSRSSNTPYSGSDASTRTIASPALHHPPCHLWQLLGSSNDGKVLGILLPRPALTPRRITSTQWNEPTIPYKLNTVRGLESPSNHTPVRLMIMFTR